MTSQEFYEFITKGAEQVRLQFDSPEDDWDPVLFTEDKNGGVELTAVGPLMENDETKDKFGYAILPLIVFRKQARQVGFLTSAWMAKVEKGGDLSTPVRDRTDRIECLILQICDGESMESYRANIFRYEDKPPMLSEWTRFEGSETQGRFVNPLQMALRFVRYPSVQLGAEILADGLAASLNLNIGFYNVDTGARTDSRN